MKLYSAAASPFGRTVKIAAHELGLIDRVEVIATTVAPTKENAAFQALNPLRKIPALELSDGTVLADSALIVGYLAHAAGDRELLASDQPNRWQVLNNYMIAKGLADCAVAARYETFVRPEDLRWGAWVEDLMDKISAGLLKFEKAPPAVGQKLTIDVIALAALLAYLDFRFPDLERAKRYPALAAWAEPLFLRPSFQATMPE